MVRYAQILTIISGIRQFGDEENTRQRCVHHTRHHGSHTQHREVLLGHIHSEMTHVPQTGKEEAAEGSDEERGRKRTAASATAVGSRCGKHLGQQHESDIDDEKGVVTIENRVVKYLTPFVFRRSVQ